MPNPSNVIALPNGELPGLGIAATAAPGTRVEGSRNEVWLCQAYDASMGGHMLYVKPGITQRAMMVEALAAQVAQCLRLPCPAPFLVVVKPHHIGRIKSDTTLLAFGCEQAGTRSLARPVHNVEIMLQLLKKLHHSEMLAMFDEWVGNSVRGPGDILFDPEGSAAIIDHEGAMQDLSKPDCAVTNWLATKIIERTDEKEHVALLKALRARAAAAHRVQLKAVPSGVQYALDGVKIYTRLLNFLSERLVHLDHLLSSRVLPDQQYLTEESHPNDPHRTADV
ncbi:MAG: hypothetical protein KBG00_10640 [Rhodoferax sp.]|jgi:hypothetical protein|uniref:HipA family kinase n=1 Tax=Rhodoferax sp. TaxID=50421 RepID=UPI001B70C7C0|nr:HipA family kinase [Rhodoferax sp.]MBP9149226.1 hypothetical protein [Rhodoferax sp.]MBP9736177.1 hypothetical protein [Rhodoferax sp.]